MDKNYSNLVYNKIHKKLNFNSIYLDSSLESVADSGTTGHYITTKTPCVDKRIANNKIPIKMLNGEIIKSTHIALLPQHNLPDNARKAHIFPGLQKPLISIGTLCDNNCIAVFDAKRVTIYDQTTRNIVMQGHRDPMTTLYMINMTAPQKSMTEQKIPEAFSANHVYETKSKQDLILFYHAAFFSPTKSIFVEAIKRNAFTSWPGLTADLVNKYLPRTEATVKGHIRQQYKVTQSTKIKQEVFKSTHQEPPEILTKRTNQIFLKVIECSNKTFTDQRGRFPITSSRGYKYIMIVYDYDTNNILAEPLKSRASLHI